MSGTRFRMTSPIPALAAVSLCLALSPATPADTTAEEKLAPGPQSTTTSTGKTKVVEGITENNAFSCPQGVYGDLPSMVLTFTMKKAGPIVVMFSGEVFGSSDSNTLLRATDNGVEFPGPGDNSSPMAIIGSGSLLGTHGFNFIKQASSGTHTIRIQCQTGSSNLASIDEQSMIILHP